MGYIPHFGTYSLIAVPEPLAEALALSQRLGMLGRRPIAEVVSQALAVVTALGAHLDIPAGAVPAGAVPASDIPAGTDAGVGIPQARRQIVDLGSGGGTPGLVVAWYRPTDEILLVERRATRADHLVRLVQRLGLTNVRVLPRDARGLRAELGTDAAAITARGFGPPRELLRMASPLLAPGGVVVVTEPPGSSDEPLTPSADSRSMVTDSADAITIVAPSMRSSSEVTERDSVDAGPADDHADTLGWRTLTAAELAALGFERRRSPDVRVAVLHRLP